MKPMGESSSDGRCPMYYTLRKATDRDWNRVSLLMVGLVILVLGAALGV